MAENLEDSHKQRQLDEIVALESIFSPKEIKRSEEGQSAGQFFANIDVPGELRVISKNPETKEEESLEVSFLPPIVLHYSLPEEYPSNPNSPPTFILTCHWLNRVQLSQLCKKLDLLWQENHVEDQGSEILFAWADFLKNDSLDFVQIRDVLDVSGIENANQLRLVSRRRDRCELPISAKEPQHNERTEVESGEQSKKESGSLEWIVQEPVAGQSAWTCFQRPPVINDNKSKASVTQKKNKTTQLLCSLDCRALNDLPQGISLMDSLYAYNQAQEKEAFCRQYHLCNVCFDTKLGSHFTKFVPCNHILCSECATCYFTSNIESGKVQNILCTEEKCNSEAHFNQIKEHISPELFVKYDKMLLDVTLATLGDIIPCPRPTCQYSVTLDGEEKLATCFYCRYAFCVDCRMGYHGVEPCRFKAGEERQLVEEYRNASRQRREELEKRYSKRRLEELMQNSMTREWIEDNSKQCPHCKVSIQKSYGCNKMVCWKCSTQFCWLCSAKLDPAFPYLHFNKPSSKCFNLLFQGMNVNEEENFMDEIEWLNEEVFNDFNDVIEFE